MHRVANEVARRRREPKRLRRSSILEHSRTFSNTLEHTSALPPDTLPLHFHALPPHFQCTSIGLPCTSIALPSVFHRSSMHFQCSSTHFHASHRSLAHSYCSSMQFHCTSTALPCTSIALPCTSIALPSLFHHSSDIIALPSLFHRTTTRHYSLRGLSALLRGVDCNDPPEKPLAQSQFLSLFPSRAL